MKSLPFYMIIVLTLGLVLLITFINTQEHDKDYILDTQDSEQNTTLISTLSEKDVEFLDILKRNVQKSDQIAKEFDFLIKEYEKTDELEGALDAMDIAIEESQLLLDQAQKLVTPVNTTLVQLNNKYQQLISSYIQGLKLQLEGIESGDGQQTTDGYLMIEDSKEELDLLLSEVTTS